MPKETTHLYADGGGWGLPSIDADGLAAHALFRFCDLEYASSPAAARSLAVDQSSPVAILPLKSADSVMASGLTKIFSVLCSDNDLPNPNSKLTPFMTAESTAFVSLVRTRLEPARLHELFVDSANYADIYRCLIDSGSSWPVVHYTPFIRRRAVRAALKFADQDALMSDACAVLKALSDRLGDRNKYFYGENPSLLDALVFGQLAVPLMVPLTRPRLRELIASHPNLVTFVERIHSTYFSDCSGGSTNGLDIYEAAELAREEAKQRVREQSRRHALAERKKGKEERAKASETQEDRDRKQGNQSFIWLSVAVFAAHVLFANEVEFGMDE